MGSKVGRGIANRESCLFETVTDDLVDIRIKLVIHRGFPEARSALRTGLRFPGMKTTDGVTRRFCRGTWGTLYDLNNENTKRNETKR